MTFGRDKTPDEVRDDAIATLERQVANLTAIIEQMLTTHPSAIRVERSPLYGLQLVTR